MIVNDMNIWQHRQHFYLKLSARQADLLPSYRMLVCIFLSFFFFLLFSSDGALLRYFFFPRSIVCVARAGVGLKKLAT